MLDRYKTIRDFIDDVIKHARYVFTDEDFDSHDKFHCCIGNPKGLSDGDDDDIVEFEWMSGWKFSAFPLFGGWLFYWRKYSAW